MADGQRMKAAQVHKAGASDARAPTKNVQRVNAAQVHKGGVSDSAAPAHVLLQQALEVLKVCARHGGTAASVETQVVEIGAQRAQEAAPPRRSAAMCAAREKCDVFKKVHHTCLLSYNV
jgi:hypothetical protein